MARMMRGGMKKCTCNLGYVIVAWILMAIGLWALAQAFITQWNAAAPMTTILGWYFGAVVILGIGKMLKWKSHGMCPVHGNKCM